VLRIRRYVLPALALLLVFLLAFVSWLQWSRWPDPKPMPGFAEADAIVVLGGGDFNRWQQGVDLAKGHPDLPLIVTGDGGVIVEYFAAQGISAERILHEQAATSTVENAKFTKPLLDKIGAKRVILVTNWFHAPRSLVIFRKYQPGREFTVSFSPKPEPLTQWDRATQRRERLAVIHNLFVHGVWSWGGE
jgi:uncharacterized SAM-binding protein YcdF (DUF218 family)